MKKTITAAALVLATVGAVTPAHAADGDFGGELASGVWNVGATAVCLAEVAVVPVLGDWAGDHVDNCSAGNVISPSRK
ncbi:hypothetical protein [Streptomyces sp. NPDC088762]|uniref:hypothetical protein n=1 Tax=Streptomyces sp. NPDC088762 TaxID=3365891 RepID=UPI003807EB2D